MRHETTATSISWIPSEAVKGMTRLPSRWGLRTTTRPPPERLGPDDLETLCEADRFRFANQLTAWIEVEDGSITGWGREGAGCIGSTTMRVGKRDATFTAVALPDLQPGARGRRRTRSVSRRPPAGAPASRRPAGSTGRRSSRSRRRWRGRPWR